MAQLGKCMVCGKKMYIGEAYRVSSTYEGFLIGYVHRSCLRNKTPKESEVGF